MHINLYILKPLLLLPSFFLSLLFIKVQTCQFSASALFKEVSRSLFEDSECMNEFPSVCRWWTSLYTWSSRSTRFCQWRASRSSTNSRPICCRCPSKCPPFPRTTTPLSTRKCYSVSPHASFCNSGQQIWHFSNRIQANCILKAGRRRRRRYALFLFRFIRLTYRFDRWQIR